MPEFLPAVEAKKVRVDRDEGNADPDEEEPEYENLDDVLEYFCSFEGAMVNPDPEDLGPSEFQCFWRAL